LRIAIADYSGHPFQVQLSRELARRGHLVLHLHFAEFQTPKGRLTVSADDPATLKIDAITLGKPFAKYSYLKRRFQEIKVGKLFSIRIDAFEPDVVIGSNLPLDALRMVARGSSRKNRPFIFWQQDIYSVAIQRLLAESFGLAGTLIGAYYKSIERTVLKTSGGVIAISEDFLPYLKSQFGVSGGHVHVVENWAPLDEIPVRPKDNPWARSLGIAHKDVVLYSGTLGMKHNPSQILEVAKALDGRPDTEVIVVSEGPGADWLAQTAREQKIGAIRVVGFQPFEVYPDVLASADILLSILGEDAGSFSVPSKVLSYLCAGRPIIISAPPTNLASRIVANSGAGIALPPDAPGALSAAVRKLLENPAARMAAGACGRAYAERAFDIEALGDKFLSIIASCTSVDSIQRGTDIGHTADAAVAGAP
jgi:colanic acid biosynthesis glycosyl transferase WcaI